MPTSRTGLALLLGAILAMGSAMGCAPASGPDSDDIAASEANLGEEVTAAGIQDGSIEAEGVLLLVNDRETTTADILNKRAGLPMDVAQAIVSARTGADGKPYWFKSLDEVDALPGTTTATFEQLLADARASFYVDEGPFDPPTLAQIEVPDVLLGTPITIDTVRVEAGFDGLSPDDVRRLVRARVPNNIHRENEQFLQTTIVTTHKSFTLGVGNLFAPNAPFASWLRNLGAEKITMLGTMSAIHPTVLLTEKAGVKSYWVRNAQGYEPIDWARYHYPIIMRAHIRLETDPAGQGVRIYYPACPLKVLEQPTYIVTEPPDL